MLENLGNRHLDRCLHKRDDTVRRGAQAAIRVRFRPIRMDVTDRKRTHKHDQKDA